MPKQILLQVLLQVLLQIFERIKAAPYLRNYASKGVAFISCSSRLAATGDEGENRLQGAATGNGACHA